ncbi:hypothetical protein SVIOM342S_03968 [Streptomyces violaceorubidus]
MGVVLPVLFALLAAFSNALATVLQRRAALSVPQSQGFRPGLSSTCCGAPCWLGGMLAVVVAGVGQAVALATGPLGRPGACPAVSSAQGVFAGPSPGWHGRSA